MSIATFGGVEIPAVYAQEIGHKFVGERGRTAGGKLRQDVIAFKRSWKLQTRPITLREANTLLDYLSSVYFGPAAFVTDEGVNVTAFIPPEDITEKRVPFHKDGAWHSDGRELTLIVVEQ